MINTEEVKKFTKFMNKMLDNGLFIETYRQATSMANICSIRCRFVEYELDVKKDDDGNETLVIYITLRDHENDYVDSLAIPAEIFEKEDEELLKKYLIDKFMEKYIERKKQEEIKELENKKEEREEEYKEYLRLKAKFEKDEIIKQLEQENKALKNIIN